MLRMIDRLLIGSLFILGSSHLARAQSVWVGNGASPAWDSRTAGQYRNWSGLILPAPGADVTFATDLSSGDPYLHGSRVINALTISIASDFALAGDPGDTLQINSGAVSHAAGSGTLSIHCGIVLPDQPPNTSTWNIAGAGKVKVNSSIVESGGSHRLVKDGAGTLHLLGSNSYSGGTNVQHGTLLADNTTGSATGGGAVTVSGDGRLGGKGFIAGMTTVNGGTLSLDDSQARILTFDGGLSLQNGATLNLELSSTTSDLIRVTAGSFTQSGGLTITLSALDGLLPGQVCTLINWTGATGPGLNVASITLAGDVRGMLSVVGTRLQFTVIGPTYYVNAAATGSSNGLSWANAFTDLQAALAAASNGSQIRVAAGTYRPTTSNDSTIGFQLKSGVGLYGGFPATGNPGFAQRDYALHTTVLTTSSAVPTLHIVRADGVDSSAILDGFTITGGAAIIGQNVDRFGGGMLINGGSAAVANCIFTNNKAWSGGAVGCLDADLPKFINCLFFKNQGTVAGGGAMFFLGGTGALYNCTFCQNTGDKSGAIQTAGSIPTLLNCIAWGDAQPEIAGNTPGSGPSASYCCIQGGWPGTANIASDPLFVDPAGNNYRLQPSSLCIGSGNNAAIVTDLTDMNGNNNTSEPIPFDLDEASRKTAGGIDMGAYEVLAPLTPEIPDPPTALQAVALSDHEIKLTWNASEQPTRVTYNLYRSLTDGFVPGNDNLLAAGVPGTSFNDQPVADGRHYFYRITAVNTRAESFASVQADAQTPAVAGIIYARAAAAPGGDGSSWAKAYRLLPDALAVASSGDQIWVASGTYLPTTDFSNLAKAESASFELKNAVAMYGGFAGTETQLSQRPADADPYTVDPGTDSILSGFLNPAIGPLFRSANVVRGDGLDPSSILGGFTVTGGFAGGLSTEPAMTHSGAGAYIVGSPTISHCVFTQNTAKLGSGMSLSGNAHLDQCVFFANTGYNGGGDGGGIRLNLSPTFDHCSFKGNTASFGAAISGEDCQPVFNHCWFENNIADRGGVLYSAGDSSGAVFNSCTLVSNHATDRGGCLEANANYLGTCTFINCVITANVSDGNGGVVDSYASKPTFTNCQIAENSAAGHGGVGYGIYGQLPFVNCIVTGNRANGDGGAFYNAGGTLALINNLMVGNRAWGAGGILYTRKYLTNPADTSIDGCTMVFNQVSSAQYSLDDQPETTLTIHNSILWGNFQDNGSPGGLFSDPAGVMVQSSLMEGGFPGDGNIDADPKFVANPSPGPDGNFDGVDDSYGDLHLQADSLCINAGANLFIPAGVTLDLDNNPRIQAGIVDIGAFESIPIIPGDFDYDGDVDEDDLSVFNLCASGPAIPNSGTSACHATDFDQDSDTDMSDFGVFQRCFSGQDLPGDPTCTN